jgi:hypothetical protein
MILTKEEFMSTDVNTAFAGQKTAQLAAQRATRDAQLKAAADKAAWLDGEVAAGRMTQTGPNSYIVTQGYDAGEVFTVNRNALSGEIAGDPPPARPRHHDR